MKVVINDQGNTVNVSVPVGTNVQGALKQAKLTLSELDRTDPPTFTILAAPQEIDIIRVKEEFEVEEKTLPFDHQTVRNETLPIGQIYLIQPGVNGKQHVTYRKLSENGKVVSRTIFKTETLIPPKAEITMIGVEAPFKPFTIPGRLAYITAGSAWMMETSTGNRTPIVTTGDMDGRVFTLSPDRSWLLFTRTIVDEASSEINALWAADLSVNPPAIFDLGIHNVIHFADWIPNEAQSIMVSTVEPRSAPPGWQANNDLRKLVIGSDGIILSNEEIIAPNTGGIYGWWGTSFTWSPDGTLLAYARPDSVGVIDFTNASFTPWINILPYQTRADWAWVPGLAWSADSQRLFIVTHDAGSSDSSSETSPNFTLTSLDRPTGQQNSLVQQSGMFANPRFSPVGSSQPRLAFLEAISPDQSSTSRYRLMVTDADGANWVNLFPPEGSMGIEPQSVVWSPPAGDSQPQYIAFIYQGNIWLINPDTKETSQITGDGLVSRISWQ